MAKELIEAVRAAEAESEEQVNTAKAEARQTLAQGR